MELIYLFRPLAEVEKILIANSDKDTHILYCCGEHGVFHKDKDIKEPNCPFSDCTGIVSIIENSKQLRKRYKRKYVKRNL